MFMIGPGLSHAGCNEKFTRRRGAKVYYARRDALVFLRRNTMTRTVLATGATLLVGIAIGVGLSNVKMQGQAPPSTAPHMTADQYDAMFKDNNNWGRWGKDDKLGTLNLLTDAKRKQAASLVKSGISISLEHDLSTEAAPDNPNPLKLEFGPTFRTDVQTYSYHGTFVTHFDALCHQMYHDKMYNDVPIAMNNAKGCANGVEHYKNGIFTRGILVDIPRLRGIPWMEPADVVMPEEITAWEKKAGVKIGPGDVVIIRTGRWARRAKMGPWRALGNAAGLHATVLPLIHQRDVMLLGGDTTADVQSDPRLVDGEAGRMPYHTAMSWLGIPLIDDFDPEAAAETAARLNRWEFLFVVAPLSVPGGTGGPVNPLAIF
jgi:kynurenine formamidase